MSWIACTLDDICDKVDGHIQTGPFGSQLHQSDYSKVGTPVVMPKDIVNGTISEEGIARVSEEHVLRLSRHKVRTGDILFSRRGDVGRCAYISPKEQGWLCGTGCLRVTVDAKVADSKFIFYYLQLASAIDWIEKHAIGATMLNLNTGILATVPIMLPSLPTQRRIASILSAYDDLIENNRRQIKLLEEAAQRLYREWFVELRFPGHESVKVMDGVPEGWMKGTVDNIVKLLSGYPFKSSEYVSSGKYRLITIKNVKDGEFSPDNVDYIDQLPDKVPSHCILTEGDILLSLTGNVGRVCIVNGYNYLLNQRVAKLQTLHPAYAYCMFRSKEMLNKMTALSNGVAQQNLSPIRAEKIRILIPSSNLLFQFKNIVEPIISQIILLNNQITFACEARDRLLPELMDGEMEV